MADSRPDTPVEGALPERLQDLRRPSSPQLSALMGWAGFLTLVGGWVAGIAGLAAGLALLAEPGQDPSARVAGALALLGAAVSFGLLANALLRR